MVNKLEKAIMNIEFLANRLDKSLKEFFVSQFLCINFLIVLHNNSHKGDY